MNIIRLIPIVLSVCLIGVGIAGVYKYDRAKAVIFAATSFFGAVTFLVSTVTAFIPDFFVK